MIQRSRVAKTTSHKEALAHARTLVQAGNWDLAVAAYDELIAAAPDNAAVHAAYGAALAKRRDRRAGTHLRRAVELEPTNSRYLVGLAKYLNRAGEYEGAADLLEAALASEPDNLQAIGTLAAVREGQGNVDDAFALYRRTLVLAPDRPQLHRAFAKFLTGLAQDAAYQAVLVEPESAGSAATHAVALSRIGRYDEAAAEFERAAEIDPASVDLRRELLSIQRLRTVGAVQHARPAPWPTRAFQFDDLEKAIRRYVLGEIPDGVTLLTRTTKVATMGSCFATHVAQRLEERGIDAFYKLIAEDINSTYANRHLLSWVTDGPHDRVTAHFQELYGEEERLDWERNLRDAELFIFSLGLATSFFDRETGEFVFTAGGDVEGAALAELYQHRNTSLEENVINVRLLVEQLRRLNPGVKIVLTVSPVPLGGTYERRSAVLADCISKSTLRLTAEEIMRLGLDDVYYWPSFEIVRWLGAHLPPGHDTPFAHDDGDTRHVSLWLQDLIIRLFIEHFSDGSIPEPRSS